MKKDDFSLVRSTLLTLTNTVPEGAKLHHILFYGRARIDVRPLYPFVARCFEKYGCPILVNGSDGRKHDGTVPQESWPGGQTYREHLMNLGVPSDAILIAEPANHTGTETEEYLKILNGTGYDAADKNVAVVAHPHQLLRIMTTLIRKLDPRPETWPRFYSLYPDRTRWFEPVDGSQGEHGDLERIRHAEMEAERVLRYQDKDCASDERLEAYFRWLENARPK